MATPTADSLFAQVWAQAVAEEENDQPGSPGWSSRKHAHWAKVWADCKALAGHLKLCEELEAKAQKVIEDGNTGGVHLEPTSEEVADVLDAIRRGYPLP